MRANELAVAGAFVFEPDVFPDDRGYFVSPMQQDALLETVGIAAFPVAQLSYSKSRAGVVRGVHFTRTPPGCAKYVHCPRGRALDIVVDLRVGSPTFGRWDAVELNEDRPRAVYFPLGVGHAFAALTDDCVISYLLSIAYNPALESAILVTDPALGLPVPAEPLMSERDRAAPTLSRALAEGLLPDYAACLELVGSSR